VNARNGVGSLLALTIHTFISLSAKERMKVTIVASFESLEIREMEVDAKPAREITMRCVKHKGVQILTIQAKRS